MLFRASYDNAMRTLSLEKNSSKGRSLWFRRLMTILNANNFTLKCHTDIKHQMTRGFVIKNWNFGSIIKDVKGNLQVFYLPIDCIYPQSVSVNFV